MTERLRNRETKKEKATEPSDSSIQRAVSETERERERYRDIEAVTERGRETERDKETESH